MPTLIYVHGRGQKGSTQQEHQKWFSALQEGLGRLDPQPRPNIQGRDLNLAYWSDLFYPPTASANGVAAATALNPQGLDGAAADAVDRISQRYWNSQLPRRSPPPAVTSNTLGMAPNPTLSATARSAAPGTASATIPLTADETRAQQYEDSFVRDVIKYFGLGFAEKVREPLVRLLRTLPVPDGLMLVCHSFGSIVAYEVLMRSYDEINAARQAASLPPLRIDSWVTMGCPLGWALDMQDRIPDWAEQLTVDLDGLVHNGARAIEEMRDRLRDLLDRVIPFGAVTAFGAVFQLGLKQFPPTGVERWINIFDPNDPVAYPPFVAKAGGGAVTVGDAFLYRGKQRAIDVEIRNDFAGAGFEVIDAEAHSDVGYGQCAQLAQLVRDFWLRWGGQ